VIRERSGICYQCADIGDLPYSADEHYFCSPECLANYEAEMEEEDE
jgi:hypothetical protein